MWGLTKVSAVLLASTTKYAPRSPQDVTGDFRELLSVLGEKAPVYKAFSSTIKFSFVTPPTEDKDWRDEDILFSDAHIVQEGTGTDHDNDIFDQVAQKHGASKPIALYLPGLDGFGISAAPWQFNDLSKTFELWRMTVDVTDRSSFGDLMGAVSGFVDQIAAATNRPVYVIGESFGGLLAPAVALRLQKRQARDGLKNQIEGLVLVNPATSFDESNWDVIAPILSTLGSLTENSQTPLGLPSPYAVVGGLALSALVPSSKQSQRIVDFILNMETTSNPSRILESIQGTLDSFKLTAEIIPHGVLEHRIKKWLIVGSSLVDPRLDQLEVPTLIVVGTEDNLIGSRREVGRLDKTLPNSEKLQVQGAGHFVLDENVNLTEAILYSKLDPLKRKPYDPILDWKLPSREVVDDTFEKSVKPLEDSFSPIFISTDREGKRSMGLDNLPREGPTLFVSNHQLCTFRSFIVAPTLLDTFSRFLKNLFQWELISAYLSQSFYKMILWYEVWHTPCCFSKAPSVMTSVVELPA
jgi:pimeloyl-ACP methyl ester carboxylesterase